MTAKNRSKRSCDYAMLSFEDAWRRISGALTPLPPVQQPLESVTGLVLAEDVIAQENIPPFTASTMDGYGVLSADTTRERFVAGEQNAGLRLDLTVKEGTAVRIMTGAPVPAGADAVIPFEQTVETDGRVRLLSAVGPGENIRAIGQDIASGETVLKKGSVLGPAEIGLLATLGHCRVPVLPRPRVSVMATGNELVPIHATPRLGQIRNSNAPAIAAAVKVCGFDAIALPQPVVDDEAELERAIVEALSKSDVLITSGGVSMGTRDLVKSALAGLGEILVGRVAIKPGKPLTFAMIHGKPVFGLPGNPVSSLVCFEQFVRPALRRMSGLRLLGRPCVDVRLEQGLRRDPDRTEFQRAIVERDPEGFTARGNGPQGSSRLKSLSGANALLVLPAGKGDYPAGSRVMALLINQPEASEDLPAGFPPQKLQSFWG